MSVPTLPARVREDEDDTPTTARPGKPRSTRRGRSSAAQRAYARRAQRVGRIAPAAEDEESPAAGRASFVVLIIGLLAVGVAATLWLSTQAIADSYRLDQLKEETTHLAERAEQLQREVAEDSSAATLAERARELGMVPYDDPAWLVVKPNGKVVVVGKPKRATVPPPPAEAEDGASGAGHESDVDDEQRDESGESGEDTAERARDDAGDPGRQARPRPGQGDENSPGEG